MWHNRPKTVASFETRVHVNDRSASHDLSDGIANHLRAHAADPQPMTIVCIGSDRSTGDALGPLVGTRLTELIQHPDVTIRGTLEQPVHAANLADNLAEIQSTADSGIVLAIDACLGRNENVGTACVKPGPLKPGTGVNKILPHVGDFHVIGVVNVGGFMEYFVLQNTRLNLVVRLAELIADATVLALDQYYDVKVSKSVAVTFDT